MGNAHRSVYFAMDLQAMSELPDHLKQPCANPLCTARFAARNVRQRYCSAKCAGIIIPPFVAIDGEGQGRGKDHRYVLLGCDSAQREWPDGVHNIQEVFEFLYGGFESNRDAIHVGFYLSYDFSMWLRMLPRERAWMLLSKQGIGKRQRRSENGHYLGPFPVEYQGWQFDLLADKRFKLRPDANSPWMYICDAGPFFQTSLLKAVDPKSWNDPVITAEEYAILKAGKERRSEAVLDDDMRYYNALENSILVRLMTRYREGMAHAGVTLKKQQWFGPGQAAQKWMRVVGTLDRPTVKIRSIAAKHEDWWDAVCSTYYGGWFVIPVHGHILGVSYEYDINSAYPHIASQLPCVCGDWRHGTGRPPSAHGLVLVKCVARGKNRYLGGLPYRTEDNHVLHPRYTQGWYWLDEIQAAKRAGLLSDITCLEWYTYQGCKHEPPLKLLAQLYENRLRIGKDTPEGKAFKLIYNSVYGKLCQSQGEDAPYSNPVYASRITSGCRTMILDAIATHPDGAEAVAMIATDGVYFLTPHPGLPVSDRLGDWDMKQHRNLTLFKPGIYWDDSARDRIAQGERPEFKARGINAEDFAKAIGDVDRMFRSWDDPEWLPGFPPGRKDWPTVRFKARFAQISVRQAVQWTEGIPDPAKRQAVYRNLAGRVQEDKDLKQDSYPVEKRNPERMWSDGRVWRSEPWDGGPHWPPSKPYDRNFGLPELEGFEGFVSPDAPVMLQFRSVLNPS